MEEDRRGLSRRERRKDSWRFKRDVGCCRRGEREHRASEIIEGGKELSESMEKGLERGEGIGCRGERVDIGIGDGGQGERRLLMVRGVEDGRERGESIKESGERASMTIREVERVIKEPNVRND